MAHSTPPLGAPGTAPIIAELGEPVETKADQQRPSFEASPSAALFPETGEQRGAEISTTAIGRNALPSAGIKLFGTVIERIAPQIEVPAKIEQGIAGLLGGVFANRGPLSDHGRINDYRNTDAVRDATVTPLVAPKNTLGPLTIFRPGLGNTAPGPAQIARLAQYTDKLIIAYANPGKGEETKLRPVNEVDGVPLPPELQGKIFAIGSPKNLMISFEQSSDLFLEQLETMRRSGVELQDAGATVVAHSQGGLDALLTRRRLIEAGFENTFGKLVTLASPFRGSPISDETMFGLFTEAGQRLPDLRQAMMAVNSLDKDHMADVIRDRDQSLVDVSLIGQCESGKDGRADLRRFFKVSDFAIEATKSIASMFAGPDVRENDGLVTVASQRFGRTQVVLDKSYDHAGIAEDWRVADQVARALAQR